MIKHIVMFRLEASEAVAAVAASKFKAAIEALPQKIDALDAVEVGVKRRPGRRKLEHSSYGGMCLI